VFNVTSKSQGCSAASSATVCSFTVSLLAGAYIATVTTYEGLSGGGTVTTQGQQVPFAAGTSVMLTTYGIPVALTATPVATDIALTGTQAAGFEIGGPGIGATQAYTLAAYDAAGNAVIGANGPAFSVSQTNANFALAGPAAASPDRFVIKPPNSIGGYTYVTIGAAFDDPATCAPSVAVCSTKFLINYEPYEYDDWVTFAHDNERTGLQPRQSAISEATLPQLKLRWKVQVPGGAVFDASPLVYKGRIIIVAGNGVVYELSPATGAVVWKRNVGGVTIGTPTIDYVHDVLFLENHTTVNGVPAPSQVFALNLFTGAILWERTLPGPMRSAAVYANGVLYEGWAGGDPPTCISGGVSAINASTGTVEWTWLTNSVHNPGGGGVWGGLAFDGTHLFFGTGNTCYTEPLGQQGAVALSMNGQSFWLYTAEPNPAGDLDTGGAVLLQSGHAIFLNKDGSLYTLDATTGNKVSAVPLGAALSYGGYASPTSDGSTIVVGAGYFSTSSASRRDEARASGEDWRTKPIFKPAVGFMSYLKAVGSGGTILWSIPMQNAIINYAAIHNGMVFAGVDSDLEAIDIHSGHVLWSYTGTGLFQAGPVVVPSGLYATDLNGYVYAFNVAP